MAVRVYPDTNIALHCKPLEELDWCALTGSDDVLIVLTSIVLRELDRHKDSSRGVIQNRARRVLSELGRRRREDRWDVRDNVRLVVDAAEPELTINLAAHGLSANVNDDRIIACMIRDRERFPNARVICFTNDNTLAFKAASQTIAVVEPTEGQLLPPEVDPVERENRELRQKLADAMARSNPQPKLVLVFDGDATHTTVRLGDLRAVDDDELEQLLDAERSRIDWHGRLGLRYVAPPAKSVDKHIERLRSWLGEHEVAERQHLLTFTLPLVLVNEGDGNADDIDIELMFDGPVGLAKRREIRRTERPQPPEPRELFVEHTLLMQARSPVADLASLLKPLPLDLGPRLKVDASRRVVRIAIRDLKHHTSEDLPRFDVWFESADVVPSGMQVRFRVHASSPRIEEGVLHVKFDVAERGLSLDPPRADDENDE